MASTIGAAGALLGAFGAGWRLSLQRVPPSADMAASPLQPLLAIAVRGAPAEPPDARREGEEEGGGDGALTGVDAGDGAAVAACAAPPPVELCFRAAAVAGPAAAHMASIERARRPGAMARFAWRRVLCVLRARGVLVAQGASQSKGVFLLMEQPFAWLRAFQCWRITGIAMVKSYISFKTSPVLVVRWC